jgi:hypothetical protein
MPPRVIKMREQDEPAHNVKQDVFSQRKRPEAGPFLSPQVATENAA